MRKANEWNGDVIKIAEYGSGVAMPHSGNSELALDHAILATRDR